MEKGYEFLIDSREKFALKKKVTALWKLPFKEYALPCGDIAMRYAPVGGKTRWLIGAERKAINDLVQSIMTKRIFGQIKRMTELYDVGFLCVTGSLEDTAGMLKQSVGIDVNENNIYGSLASIMVRNKFHLCWFPDDMTMFKVMYAIMMKVAEGKYGEPMRTVPKFSKFNAISALSDHIPGVNKKIAGNLLKKFGSLKNIAACKPEHLTSVDGVGTSTATLINRFLCEMNK